MIVCLIKICTALEDNLISASLNTFRVQYEYPAPLNSIPVRVQTIPMKMLETVSTDAIESV